MVFIRITERSRDLLSANKQLHVLVIATWYPIGWDKLIGIYHKQFCEALATAGVKVNMLHIDRQAISSLPTYPFRKKRFQIAENGYTTYIRRMLNRGRISEHLQIKAYSKCLEKLYREYEAIHGKPDVLHAQGMIPAGYATCCLGEKIGVPVIITEHGGRFERFFSNWAAPYAKETVEKASKFTCVGEYMTKIYSDYCHKTATVLPNIVDCSVFSGPKVPNTDGKLHLISVGALRPGKNFHHAVEALHILRTEGRISDFHYTIVGDGYFRDTYYASVEEHGMTDCVSFVGQKNHEEIAQLLSKSDILLLPSEIESFGIPAVEATAAGVPVVCTRCCGPEGFLNEDCAEFSQVGDPRSIADAIERMVQRLPDLDEAAIRRVSRQFDSAVVAQQAISLYQDMLHEV